LELASTGRLVAFAGVGLGIVGFLFSNGLIVIFAGLLCVYLLAEGIAFRRAVNIVEGSIRVETSPRNVETTVGLQSVVETTLQNPSGMGLRVMGFRRNLPSAIRQEVRETELLLRPHDVRPISTVLEVTSPGRYRANDSTLRAEDFARLFRQSLTLTDRVTVVARPIVRDANPLPGLNGLPDLAADPVRRGTGTDLAGIHPASSLEDLGRIDWKATARVGKLMVRDFYLERDPSIMLLVDASVLTIAERARGPDSKTLLGELATLLANAKLARSSIGLILYDERAVIAKIEARLGLENRERILQALLERAEHAPAAVFVTWQRSKSYSSLATETQTITRRLESVRTAPIPEVFAWFARAVLPFYRNAMSKYALRLRKDGAFRAFEITRELDEPMLVIAISSDRTGLDGLYEGARQATMSNHRVIIAFPVHPGNQRLSEWLSNPEEMGIRTVLCPPEGLWSAINAELLDMSRARFREFSVETPQKD